MSESLSLSEVQTLMQSMKEHDIGSFFYKTDTYEIKLKLKAPTPIITSEVPASSDRTVTLTMNHPGAEENTPAAETGKKITSPLVGTFYASPSPEKPPYVQVGDMVATGDTLFIIESMKLMNEVTSEHSGTIKKILVEDGQSVEYGQPILIIE